VWAFFSVFLTLKRMPLCRAPRLQMAQQDSDARRCRARCAVPCAMGVAVTAAVTIDAQARCPAARQLAPGHTFLLPQWAALHEGAVVTPAACATSVSANTVSAAHDAPRTSRFSGLMLPAIAAGMAACRPHQFGRQRARSCYIAAEAEEKASPPEEESADAKVEDGENVDTEEQEVDETAKDDEVEETKEEEKKLSKWACGDCGSSNFANSTECHKCGALKPSGKEFALLEEKAKAKEEVTKAMDSLMRLQAELQNYRRQHTESMSRAQELGKKDALRKLVPFTKELTEALTPPENMTEKEQALFNSYSLLFSRVFDIWNKFGVESQKVEVGDRFDPSIHRKAGEREAEGDEAPGAILEVVESGWLCEGQILVPSEVTIVAFPKEEVKETQLAEEEDDEEMSDEAQEDDDELGDAESKDEGEEVKKEVEA